MTNEVSLTISKILNWNGQQNSSRTQVAFYGVNSGAYLSHKTTIGYSSQHALLLNTSFKIQYNPHQHLVNCKITNLEGPNGTQVIGCIEIDLGLLADRTVLFLPFEDHDKVLEVRLYQQKKESETSSANQMKKHREQFLHQRFQFMDKIANNQSDLKKKFSERVYNFLKELKNRNFNEVQREGLKSHNAETIRKNKYQNQIEFRGRFNEQKGKGNYCNDFASHEDPYLHGAPKKVREKQDLMINSVRALSLQSDAGRLTGQRDDRQISKDDQLDVHSRRDFGGLLNNSPQ